MGLAIITNTVRQSPEWPFAVLQQLSHCISLETRNYAANNNDAITLTKRQKAILLRMAKGMTDQAAAVDLHISVDTVRYHKRNLYHLLGAENNVAAVVQAIKTDLLSLEELI